MDKVTRVKYSVQNGIYVSTKQFLGNGGTLMHAEIDPVTNTAMVLVHKDNGFIEPVESMETKSFTKAKTAAKGLLKKYGVNFFEECRRKKEVIS